MIRMRKWLLWLSLLLCGSAQAQTCISGHVTTADNKPLALVSIALFRDSIFLSGTLSNNSGRFCLPAALAMNTSYTLRLSLVGYLPRSGNFTYPDTSFLSHLVLTEREHMLAGVTVTAKKPLITRKADRYIVNVENSYLANGKSGLEVLQQSPGLWLKNDGSIRIRGSQQATVMINNVVQSMSDTELTDYLSTLKSEDISKIEIIPNPPGEYEASATGGIVHIILKNGRQQGFTGSVYGSYKQQGKKPYSSGGGSLDLKRGKLYFFGSLSSIRDKSLYTGYTHVRYPDGSTFHSAVERDNNNTRYQYRVTAAFDFSPSHSLNIQTTAGTSELLQYFSSGILYQQPRLLTTGNAKTEWIRHPQLSSTTLNYAWKLDSTGSSVKLITDYTDSRKAESNTLVSAYSDTTKNSNVRTRTPSTTNIYSLQEDYTKMTAANTAFKTGAKYVVTWRYNRVIMDNYNGNLWIENPGAGNEFQYNEKLMMGYISFEKKFRLINLKTSLRGEQTYARGHSMNSNEYITNNYFGLFPSFFLSRLLNEKKGNSIQLTYSRRVKRPGYNDLNPYRLQLHDYTILTGNPDLLPQFTHSLEGSYTLLQNYTATTYFMSTRNFIAQTATTVNGNIIEYQSKNFKGNTEYGMALNASNTIGRSWNINTSVALYHVKTELAPTLTQTSFSIKTVHTIALKKIADIDVYAEYSSPYLSANARQTGIFDMDLGITKKIGNNKLRFSLSDIFNTVREKDVTQYNRTRIDFYQKRPTRTASLSFTFNFKRGKKFAQKRLEQNNSEEKSRLGN